MNSWRVVDHGNCCSLYVEHVCGHEIRYTMGCLADAEETGKRLMNEVCGVCKTKERKTK